MGRTAKVQNVLTSTKLLVIAGFVMFGFLAGTGDWSHFSEPAVRTSTVSLPAQFVVSLLWVMVGYSGWNAATYVAEEVRRPERTLPAAIAAGSLIVAVLYLGLNMVFIYATPLEQMKGEIAIGTLSASNLFGPGVAGIFSALMALSIVSTVSAEVTVGPRVYYAMAKNRAFFSAAAKVDPRWHTPVNAIIAQGAVRDAHDADAVSGTGGLHRLSASRCYGALRGVGVHLPAAPRGMAAGARAGFRVAADPRIVYSGWDLHDGVRRDLAAEGVADRAGHGGR